MLLLLLLLLWQMQRAHVVLVLVNPTAPVVCVGIRLVQVWGRGGGAMNGHHVAHSAHHTAAQILDAARWVRCGAHRVESGSRGRR